MSERAGKSSHRPEVSACLARRVSLARSLSFAAACVFVAGALAPHSATGQVAQVRGQVVDGSNGSAVISAFVTVDGTRAYDLTDEDGLFLIDLDGELPPNRELRVSALGYIPQVVSLDATSSDAIVVTLQPRPILLEGIEAEVGSYQQRLRVRRNGTPLRRRPLAIGLEALNTHWAENVWEMAGSLFGFSFEGYSDYGCAIANIEGSRRVVELLIDDQPVRLADFTLFQPRDFALVEVWRTRGPWILQAYSQDYLNQSTMAGRRPPPLEVMRTLCPTGGEDYPPTNSYTTTLSTSISSSSMPRTSPPATSRMRNPGGTFTVPSHSPSDAITVYGGTLRRSPPGL